MFSCRICDKTFTRCDNLTRHKKQHCSESTPNKMKCSLCSVEILKRDMGRHLYKVHGNPPQSLVYSETLKGVGVHMNNNKMPSKRRVDEASTSTATLPSAPKKQRMQRCDVCEIDVSSVGYSGHLRSHSHLNKCAIKLLNFDDVFTVRTAFKNRIATYKVNLQDGHDLTLGLGLVREKFRGLVHDVIAKFGSIKLNLEAYAYFIHPAATDASPELKSFNSKYQIVTSSTDLDQLYNTLCSILIMKSEEFQERNSSFAFHKISHLLININKYVPIAPRSYIPLPAQIQKKHAVVNVQNPDDACFAWTIMSALYPATHSSNRTSSYPHYTERLRFDGIDFPVTIKDISKFETMNNISVNVYGLDHVGKTLEVVGPYHIAKEKRDLHVNMLLLDDGEKQHYCWIKNLSRLVRSQISKREHAKFFCDGCLIAFGSEKLLTEHAERDCNHVYTKLPSTDLKKDKFGNLIPGNILKFDQFDKKMKVPFVVYADFESYLEPITSCQHNSDTSNTESTHKHIPYSFAYYLKCTFDDKYSKIETYRGRDCASVFVQRLTTDAKDIYNNHLKHVMPMQPLTDEQKSEFLSASTCFMCEKDLQPSDKVADHCHITGEFRGAAHSVCNLNFKIPKFLPVFCHNMSGYDAHLFIKELAAEDEENIDVIPQNKEKYISFSKHIPVDKFKRADCGVEQTVYMKLRFLDSFRFMASSIEKLAGNLQPHQFRETRKFFQNQSDFDLVTKKGIFPYSYVTDFDKLKNTTSLPTHKDFFNSMTNTDITKNEYEHAQKVWSHFDCKNLGEYSDLYVKTDVLLLADIFENFRNICKKAYDLDPAHFYTSPGLTWAAMLKYTKIELDLLTDIDMIHFIKNSIRGGISQCSLRHARANNPYMAGSNPSTCPSYDPSAATKYLAYWDFNNLYGWAMSQILPQGDFRWLTPTEIENFNVFDLDPAGSKGYFVEVDLEYPQNLHDKHNDLPFCPEKKCTPNCNQSKLVLDLHEKTRYVMHYRNLQQALANGLVLKHVHRVLEFTQSAWLKTYIDLNTDMRQRATNDFEKDFYKLMNNAAFGKTMESVDKRVNVHLSTHWENRGRKPGAERLIAKPNFHSVAIFNENFCAIQLSRLQVTYDKPIYIGFTVLELSKWLLYDFFYNYLQPMYGDKMRLCYVDTDSLTLFIETDDLYKDMMLNLEKFDTSNFDDSNPYGIPRQNKAIPGLMKDENGGKVMWEFVGLRSKLYCNNVAGKLTKKAKGVKKYVVQQQLDEQDYLDSLHEEKVVLRKQTIFRSILHTIYTQDVNKVAISPFDTKRYIVPTADGSSGSGVDTLAWGHYAIPSTAVLATPTIDSKDPETVEEEED